MAGKKSTKVIYEERITIVTDMLLSGLKRREILQNIAINENLKWKVTDSQVDNYIRDATNIILKNINEDRGVLITKAHARYEYIYKKLINVKDYKGALIAIEKSATLLGLNAPTKVANTDKEGNDVITPFNDSQVEKILHEIRSVRG